jgi:hypothetical protein
MDIESKQRKNGSCNTEQRPLHKCLGCVLINCYPGYSDAYYYDFEVVAYSVKECANITRSGVCKKCRRITMNFCGEKSPKVNYESLIDIITKSHYSLDEEVRFVDSSEKVYEIFNAVDWSIRKLSHQSRIKYCEKNNLIFRNTKL